MDFIFKYLVTGLIFVTIDALWLKFIAGKFYKSQIGSMLRDKPSIVPAVTFYLIYTLGIVEFALGPAFRRESFTYAIVHGALLGLIAYAAYGLVNNATLKNWTTRVTVVDTLWGTFVTCLTATIAFWILK